MRRLRIGERQMGALEVYVFDPVHADDPEMAEGLQHVGLDDNVFEYDARYADAVRWLLTDAANSADATWEHETDPELRRYAREDREALTALSMRIR